MAKKSMDDLLKRRMSAAQQASELEVGNEAYETMFQAKADAAAPRFCELPIKSLCSFHTADIGFHPYPPEKLRAFSQQLAEQGIYERIIVRPIPNSEQYEILAGNPSAADPNDPTARSSRMMMWMMPIMSLWIGFTLPASLGVYWIANSVLMLVQEKVLNKYFKKSMAAEDEAREKARMEDRLRRMEEARVAQQQREAEKKSLKEKQKAAQAAKAAKAEKARKATTENGRIGDRPYARGRSFNADHYGE